MNSNSNYKVGASSDGVNVSGPQIEKNSKSDWSVCEFGPGRVLLQSSEVTKFMPDAKEGSAWCPVDVFTDFIFGVHYRGWTGTVVVDTGFGVKKIYFVDGDVVFASTNVIDDRLGEILYRKGLLSIDELMDTSVQVNRSKKFGQVLLSSGIFTNLQLWDALKTQVRELVRSVFMAEHVYFEMHSDATPAPTEVVFSEGGAEFLESCFGYGCMYRDFSSRLDSKTMIEVVDAENIVGEVGQGNFVADLIGMINQPKPIKDILKTSKLLSVNTLAALMQLVNRGICQVVGGGDARPQVDKVHLARLRAKLDVYSFMLSEVHKAFKAKEVRLPVGELAAMVVSMDEGQDSTILLDDLGEITSGSVDRMFSQCKSIHNRVEFFRVRIDCLIQFLLQLTLDHLPYDDAKQVRAHYRKLVL